VMAGGGGRWDEGRRIIIICARGSWLCGWFCGDEKYCTYLPVHEYVAGKFLPSVFCWFQEVVFVWLFCVLSNPEVLGSHDDNKPALFSLVTAGLLDGHCLKKKWEVVAIADACNCFYFVCPMPPLEGVQALEEVIIIHKHYMLILCVNFG
jgi:hypothetical protein